MISQDDCHRQEVLRIFDAVLVERVDSHNSQDRSRPTHDVSDQIELSEAGPSRPNLGSNTTE